MTTDVNSVASTMTSSNGKKSTLLALFEGINRSPVDSPHKGQWRGSLMFSLVCAWTNGGTNNLETADLRRNHAHKDVTVMNVLLEARSSTHYAQQWPDFQCGFWCYLRMSSASCNVWGRGWFLVSGKVSKSMAANAQLDPRITGTASGLSRDYNWGTQYVSLQHGQFSQSNQYIRLLWAKSFTYIVQLSLHCCMQFCIIFEPCYVGPCHNGTDCILIISEESKSAQCFILMEEIYKHISRRNNHFVYGAWRSVNNIRWEMRRDF